MPGNYRVSGALFAKTAQNGPVYSGVIEIDGVKTAISIWEKTSAAGNQYLQISEDKRGQEKIDGGGGGGGASKFKRPTPNVPQPKPNADMDDDIPF